MYSYILPLLLIQRLLLNLKFSHLKRARKSESLISNNSTDSVKNMIEVILCPYEELENLSTDIREKFPTIKKLPVCKYEPATRAEFDSWGKLWPVHFRSSEQERNREKGLSDEEVSQICMSLHYLNRDIDGMRDKLGKLGCMNSSISMSKAGGVVINPLNSVVS